jgi:hypothetical protein
MVADGVCMLLLKLSGRGKMACEYAVTNGSKVFWSLLELAGTNGYEVGSQ